MPVVSRSIETKNYLIVAAVLVLAAGYADLVRGGVTLSALLLALAYCGLIPLAIWRAGRPAPSRDAASDERPSYGVAAAVAAVIFGLYLLTMAPSTAMWDTSEYIAAAYTFGLPHPPGNPFFVIVGRVFSILPIAGNVAARINVLAALSSAIAAGMWFLVAEQILRAWIEPIVVRRIAAMVCALVGATAFTVWNQ